MKMFAFDPAAGIVSPIGYVQYMRAKRRVSTNGLVCPLCGGKDTIRKILYGMPDLETFDFEKYAVGGCCMNGDGSDPEIACKECDWEGFVTDLPSQSQLRVIE